jgi:tetratricopeptide (TPR) repeat protein
MIVRTRALVLLIASATLLVAGVAIVLRPRRPPGDRAKEAASAQLLARDVERAVRTADLAFAALDGAPDAACLSAVARAADGDLPAAFARLEWSARRAPDAPEPALAAGLVARLVGRRMGPGVPGRDAVRRRAALWLDEATRRADALASRVADPFPLHVLAACARLAAGDRLGALQRAEALTATTAERREEAACVRAAALVALDRCDEAALVLRDVGRAHDPRTAVALERIEAIRRADAVPDVERGFRAWAAGDAPTAAARLARWADSHPSDLAALAGLASALARLDRTDEVVQRLDRLARLEDAGPALPWFRACHLLAQGRPDEAATAFDVAAARAPDDPRVIAGRVHAGLASLGEARARGRVAAFEDTVRLRSERRPDDPVDWLVLACAADLRGDLDLAESRYRATLRLDPRNGVAANNLAWLLAVRRARPAEALPLAEQAVRLLGASAHALDTRGTIRRLLGDAAGATEDHARATSVRPRSARFAVHHAEALIAARRPDEARDELRRALGLDPSLRDDPSFRDVGARAELERSP